METTFDIFNKWETIAPQNLDEMDEFIALARKEGFDKMADTLEKWANALKRHREREFGI